jgi:FSR family fosmidomycin resistance protein-like MFS transporter
MIFGLLGNLAGGRLGDRSGRRRIIVLGMSVAILSTVGFILLPQGIWTWILIALVGAGLFATVPLTVIMGQDIAPENRSFGSGMAVGLSNALGAIGLMALGLIAGTFGVLAVLWIGVAIGAVSIPLLWLMNR